MANQIIVTKDHAVQVSVEPTPQVQVSYSRSAILSITTVDHANTANTVTNNAQPNITSVGTLTGLNVNGNVTANFFLGNLVGNISGNFTVPGSNTAILYNETGNAGASDAFKFDYASNTVNLIGNLYASNLHGEGGNLSNIQAGNVIGNIANANFASFANVANIANTSNSVNVANVVGIGNIAVLNLDGNAGNILYGNGVFSAVPNISNVANANFANFAGNIVNGTSNVTIPVANGNVYVNANAGTDKQWNFGTDGNLVLPNLAVLGDAYNDGGISLKAAPNGYSLIASNDLDQYVQADNTAVYIGTDYPANNHSWIFQKDGNTVFPQNSTVNLGNQAVANYFSGDGHLLSNINGSNITGTVANANFASYANLATTANSVSVANVVGIGNIATTNYDGNASNILYGNGGFYALPTISNVGNANFANYAGNAFSVSGSNVVGQVANANYSLYSNIANTANLATFATTANSVAGANVSGQVANANYALYANIASTANTVAGANVTGVVANANYATYAGTAYSVSGSNVSGEVANANYATYAGTAYSVSGSNVTGYVANSNHATVSDSANSVAVANVVGIGNIATTNYDGNANHVLYGNGAWANIPTVSNVANANYANFAGTVITNAQPNITSVGTLGNLSVTGTITTGAVDAGNIDISGTTISTLNDLDLQIQANGIHISDTTSSSEVDVFSDGVYVKTGGDTYNWQFSETGNFVLPGNTFAINYANGSPVNLDGPVANANYANFAGNAFSVNGANVSGTVANANYAAFSNVANSANSVAGANVTGIVANANYAAFSNVANTANLVAGANVSGIVANANYAAYAGNVTSTVANANFAAYAGNVTVASQGNITTVGNLLNLNIVNTTANSTQFLFTPNGTNVGLAGQNTASFVINQFNTQPGISNQVLNMQFTAARGNATNPSNVANADYIGSMSWNTWNTNTYIRNARVTVLAPQGGNTAQWGSNVTWGAGSYFINTGNPLGNITSNTSLTTQNIFGMTPFGALSLTPGTPGPNAAVQNALTLVSYGANTDGAGGIVNRIVFQRARGNRDSNQTVQNGDGVGGFFTTAYGNGAFSTSGAASMYMQVDTAYGNITSTFVPIRLNFSTQSSNGTNYTTAFLPDGNVTFPSGGAVISSYYYGDGSNLSNISGSNITGAVNLANYATTANSVAGANVSGQVGNALIAGTVYTNAQPNITSTGTLTGLTVSGNANISNLQLNQFQETVYSYGSASGTITPDFNNGSIQQLTLTGNITMNSLGNAIAGRSMTLILTQDGTGNRTLTSTMKFAGGSKTLSTAASAIDIISVFYDGSTYYSVLSKGYA